jgi:hypothetical protein
MPLYLFTSCLFYNLIVVIIDVIESFKEIIPSHILTKKDFQLQSEYAAQSR